MHNKLLYFMRFAANKDIMYLVQKDTHTFPGGPREGLLPFTFRKGE